MYRKIVGIWTVVLCDRRGDRQADRYADRNTSHLYRRGSNYQWLSVLNGGNCNSHCLWNVNIELPYSYCVTKGLVAVMWAASLSIVASAMLYVSVAVGASALACRCRLDYCNSLETARVASRCRLIWYNRDRKPVREWRSIRLALATPSCRLYVIWRAVSFQSQCAA